MKKPRTIYLSPGAKRMLDDPDALSTRVTAFRNGGTTNDGEAVPFVELTPDLIGLLRAQEWDSEPKREWCGKQWGGGEIIHTCDLEKHDGPCHWPGQ